MRKRDIKGLFIQKLKAYQAGLYLVFCALLFGSLIYTGYGAGRLINYSSTYFGSHFSLLLSIDTSTMNAINRLIYSPSVEGRLAGYYSIIDTGVYDQAALLKRYAAESNIVVKKAIIFIIFYKEGEAAREVLDDLKGLDTSEEQHIADYIDILLITDTKKQRPLFEPEIKF